MVDQPMTHPTPWISEARDAAGPLPHAGRGPSDVAAVDDGA
jgi:hypothetical protein